MHSNDLTVVAPRKTVFISRLDPNTSIDNIRNYIKSKVTVLSDNDFNMLNFHQDLFITRNILTGESTGDSKATVVAYGIKRCDQRSHICLGIYDTDQLRNVAYGINMYNHCSSPK